MLGTAQSTALKQAKLTDRVSLCVVRGETVKGRAATFSDLLHTPSRRVLSLALTWLLEYLQRQ